MMIQTKVVRLSIRPSGLIPFRKNFCH